MYPAVFVLQFLSLMKLGCTLCYLSLVSSETLFKEKSLLSDLKFIRPVSFLCVQKQFGAEKFLEVS